MLGKIKSTWAIFSFPRPQISWLVQGCCSAESTTTTSLSYVMRFLLRKLSCNGIRINYYWEKRKHNWLHSTTMITNLVLMLIVVSTKGTAEYHCYLYKKKASCITRNWAKGLGGLNQFEKGEANTAAWAERVVNNLFYFQHLEICV